MTNSGSSYPLMWGEDLVRASAAGHEIGCHTYSHPHMPELRTAQLKRELSANLDAVRSVLPDVHFASFAYPFGEVSVRAKRLIASKFAVARGVRPGLNGRVVDLSELRAQGLRSRHFDRAQVSQIVRHAVSARAWLVFVTHDIVDEPSPWGCTPAEFEFALSTVRRAGIEILTLKAALGRLSHRNASD
jgi:peptidoglycan/xylan/chitin deacetylase (PgdA/CDA1 family)